jgi:hypothetical protein
MNYSPADQKLRFFQEIREKIEFSQDEQVRASRRPHDMRIRDGHLAGAFIAEKVAWRSPDGSISDRPAGKAERVVIYRPEDPPVDLGKFPNAERVAIYLPGSEPGATCVETRLIDYDAQCITLALPSAWQGKVPKRILLGEIVAEFEQRLIKGLNMSPDWPALPPAKPQLATLEEAKALLPMEDASVHQALRLMLGNNDFCGIKGPPGTGKTRLLARFVADAVERNLTVGIVSLSHRAVNNALNATVEMLGAKDQSVTVMKLGANRDGLRPEVKSLSSKDDPNPLPIWGGTVHAAAGLFKSDKLSFDPYFQSRRRDILIVDEAGQVPAAYLASLAYLAKRVILFGDEDQLPPISAQPGREVASGLKFLLQTRGEAWMRSLLVSHRLNSQICHVVQKHYYPGLNLRAGTNRTAKVNGPDQPSIGFINVPHANRTSRSDEEIDVIKAKVSELLTLTWSPGGAAARPITPRDIMILSPYRVQVAALMSALEPLGLADQVGTVDRMQGQGAAVVIMSLTSSSPSYIANKCDWLFQSNRINVAISRAMAQCILVGNRKAIEESRPVSLGGVISRNAFLTLLDDCQRLPLLKA